MTEPVAQRWLTDRRAFQPVWEHRLEDWVAAVAVSPDGALVAAGSSAGDAVVLDTVEGRPVGEPDAHGHGVSALAWSFDGGRLATGGQDGAVRLWDRAEARPCAEWREPGWVGALAWAANGMLAVAVGKCVVVADRDGAVLARYRDATSTVTSLAWSSDGRRLAAGSYGGVHWYEPSTDRAKAHKFFAWKGSVLAVAISPDDKWLVGGAQDNTIHVWRLWAGTDCEMSGFASKVDQLTWHHSGRWMMAGCVGMLTRWDFSGKGPAGRNAELFETNDTRVLALRYQPRGDLVAGALADGDGGALVVWKPGRSRQPAYGYPLGELCGRFAWSVDGSSIIAGTASGRLARVAIG
ncbi:MAG: WD40 repeat domain-containing protein [Acidimicrobiales bacterium]|nr:WD40 repeat domain-containing protein [Acidimicrobiales bacterium]